MKKLLFFIFLFVAQKSFVHSGMANKYKSPEKNMNDVQEPNERKKEDVEEKLPVLIVKETCPICHEIISSGNKITLDCNKIDSKANKHSFCICCIDRHVNNTHGLKLKDLDDTSKDLKNSEISWKIDDIISDITCCPSCNTEHKKSHVRGSISKILNVQYEAIVNTNIEFKNRVKQFMLVKNDSEQDSIIKARTELMKAKKQFDLFLKNANYKCLEKAAINGDIELVFLLINNTEFMSQINDRDIWNLVCFQFGFWFRKEKHQGIAELFITNNNFMNIVKNTKKERVIIKTLLNMWLDGSP